MKHSLRLVSAGALLAAGIPVSALAQVPVTVSVNVQGSCAVSVPVDAAYGNFTPAAATTNITWTGAVTLRCNQGAAPSVAVNDGLNSVAGQRFMLNGVDTLAYAVKKPTIAASNFTVCPAFGAGTDWTASGLGRLDASGAFTASGGNRTVNLCVQSTITDVLATGMYTDTVQVSVTF